MNEQTHQHKRQKQQLKRPASIDRSGFSKTRLDRMHEAMQRHVGPGKIPGLVTLIHHRGRTHVDTIGAMAFDNTVPMQRNTIFRLASTTKPIAAVATMILVEECKLRLDDPVDEWLPELKDRKVLRTIDSPLDDTVPAKRRITLRDLLTFRSGYGEVGLISPTCPLSMAMLQAQMPLVTFPFPGTADEFMKRLGQLPLAYQPGERWQYHMSLEILGVLIARVSGQSLSTFMRSRIFEPLGMNDTGFRVPESKLDRLPTCYGTDFPRPNLIVLHEARGDYVSSPGVFESGAGGLVSTVDDLHVFGQMMMNYGTYGRQRILSRPTVELMITDHLTPEQKAGSPFFENFWTDRGWGLGLGLVTARTDVANSPGRFGWDGAFGTSWWVDPKEQLIGVLMAQRRPDVLGIAESIRDFWTSAYQLIDD